MSAMRRFGDNYTRRPIMPWGKSPCPCGSDRVFRECCRPHLKDLPLRPDAGAHAVDDPDLALTLARAEFTRYTIWHETNTRPWYEADPAGAAELMDIDAEALGDLLGIIRAVSRSHPDHPTFSPALDRNADLLPTRRWREILLRERILDALGSGDDDATARELAKTLDLEELERTELLALVLPYRDELSISERLRVIDRIIDDSEDWEERVRFLCYRAILWELHGDEREAARGFLKAVKAVPKDPAPTWAHALVVEAFEHAGRSNARADLKERALELCEGFLAEAVDEPSLEAELRQSRSHVLAGLDRDAEAVEDLRWVVDRRGTYDDRIQLAKALIALGEFEDARGVLESIEYDELTPGEQYDHTFALFGLLYGIQEEKLVALVGQRLGDLEPEFPVWREVRDRFLLALSRWPEPEKEEYPAWWASVREVLVLQPNVFGIGVDVARILDQALRRRVGERAQHRDPDAT